MIITCKNSYFEQGVSLLNEYLAVKPKDKFLSITATQGEENKAVGKDGGVDRSRAE